MNKKRNYGIDLLRILAMFMVVVLHILGVGGVIYTIDSSSRIYITAWLLEFAAYCAVNCYALISGYVGIDSKFRFSSIMHLWIQVAFTTIVITIGFYFLDGDVTLQNIKESCTPITSQLYWYFTAYVALYFLIPYLNLILMNLSKKMAKTLLLVLLIWFSVIPTFWETDLFYVRNGYSVAWLIILYLVGGIVKKYYSEMQVKKRILLGGYVLAVFITILSKLVIEYLKTRTSFSLYESNFLMNYNSPTIVWAGISLLLLFSNFKIEKMAKPIAVVAPFTFGVYIIHTHPMVWDRIIANRFTGLTDLHPIVFVVAVIFVAIAIFGVCSGIEFVRKKLFCILRVSEFCKFIEKKGKDIFERIIKNDTENCE